MSTGKGRGERPAVSRTRPCLDYVCQLIAMKKKQLIKELEQYKQKIDAVAARDKVLRKEIKRLKKELKHRQQMLDKLESQTGQGKSRTEGDDPLQILQHQRKQSVASVQRKAWVRHEFLRDRYEFHLEAGLAKQAARKSANRDLQQEYGTEQGYSDEALRDILS